MKRTGTSTKKGTVLESGEILTPTGGLLRPAWKPGQSGNPLGRRPGDPSAYERARQICAQASDRAAQVQVELLEDPDPRIRILATEAVLNRGAGKVRDHSNDQPTRLNLDALGTDERTTLAMLLRKIMGS